MHRQKVSYKALHNISLNQLWVLTPFLISFTILCLNPLKEGDLWWHISLGEQISQTNKIPDTDVFTFTAFGQPYYFGRAWLSDLLFFWLQEIGDLAALVLCQAIVGTVIIGFLLYQSLESGANARLSSIFTLIGLAALFPFLGARPQIFSFVLFALISHLLWNYRRGVVGWLWLLPCIIAIWVNLHAAWVIGVLLLAAFTGLSMLEIFLQRRSLHEIRPLLLWVAVSLGAILLNPEGVGILRDPLAAGTNTIIQQSISEWQPPALNQIYALPFYFLFALLLLILSFSKRRPGIFDFSLLLVFLMISFRYVRMLPFFYILAIPILAGLASGMSLRTIFGLPDVSPNRRTQGRLGSSKINFIFVTIMAGAALLSLPYVRLALTSQPQTILISPYFPMGASDWLDEFGGTSMRLFSMPEWGGYLIWKHYPDGKVFIDGRVELFPMQVWEDYIRISSAEPDWQELLKSYEINYMVLSQEKHGELIQALKTAGKNCFFEDEISILCKVD